MSSLYLSMSLDKASWFTQFVNPLTLKVATENWYCLSRFKAHWKEYLGNESN